MDEGIIGFMLGIFLCALIVIFATFCYNSKCERMNSACNFAGYDTFVINADGEYFCTYSESLVLYE